MKRTQTCTRTKTYATFCAFSRRALISLAHLLVPLVGAVVRHAVEGVEVFLPRRVGLPENTPWAVVKIVFVKTHPWDSLRGSSGC